MVVLGYTFLGYKKEMLNWLFVFVCTSPRKVFVHSSFISHQEHLRKRVALYNFYFSFLREVFIKKKPFSTVSLTTSSRRQVLLNVLFDVSKYLKTEG